MVVLPAARDYLFFLIFLGLAKGLTGEPVGILTGGSLGSWRPAALRLVDSGAARVYALHGLADRICLDVRRRAEQ